MRSKVAKLIGGIPEPGKQVTVRQFGAVRDDGVRVGEIAYESLPGLWVTANVYVPLAVACPSPAVLLPPGHEPSGTSGGLSSSRFIAIWQYVAPPGVLRAYDLGGRCWRSEPPGKSIR